MNFVSTTDDVNLYFKDWGRGRPVVLIHGWPLSSDSWDEIAIHLASSGYRVLSYDRRGFGRSSQPWQSYAYDTLSDDLAAIMRETGIDDATLVGFSMGGGEVVRYMSRHEGKGVAQAVLIGSIVPYMLKTSDNPNGTDAAVFDQIGGQIKADRSKFFAGFFQEFFRGGKTEHEISDEFIRWSWSVAMQASLKATLECAGAFGTTDFRSELNAVDVPTLIIHGTGDKIVPIDASARPAAKGIEGATLKEYEGAPHGLLATHRDRICSDLLTFLKG